MGCPGRTPVTLAEQCCFLPVTIDENALGQLGLSHRPELQRDHGLITSAKADVATAVSAQRLDAFLFVGSVAWNGPFAIGAGFTLPLFDWGPSRLEHQRTCTALAAQQQRLQVTSLGITRDIREAIAAVKSTTAQVATLHDEELIPAEKLKDIAIAGYQKGEKKCLDVFDAYHNLRTVQGEYYTAISAYRTALATLEWAVGTPVCAATP